MDVRDKKRMPDADRAEFVVPETLAREIARSVADLDQDRHASGADSVNLFLHEAGDGGGIVALFKFQESAPECPYGAAGECGEVVNSRKAKLVNEVQQLDVAILELEAVFRRHGVGDFLMLDGQGT